MENSVLHLCKHLIFLEDLKDHPEQTDVYTLKCIQSRCFTRVVFFPYSASDCSLQWWPLKGTVSCGSLQWNPLHHLLSINYFMSSSTYINQRTSSLVIILVFCLPVPTSSHSQPSTSILLIYLRCLLWTRPNRHSLLSLALPPKQTTCPLYLQCLHSCSYPSWSLPKRWQVNIEALPPGPNWCSFINTK